MNDVVISARGLGKRYLIGHQSVDRNQTFRERIMAGAGGLVRNIGRTGRGEQLIQGEVEEFWALKDLDFDIRRGDTVGIIGRNGAGKSTLLKILSRITEPTTGRVDIRGRVASLLEVGTGFHPELTGRENIFLNGAILGMSRAEIRRKLDEIIDFAGVEKFLDTPVKRYSSGMGVRLAFSVAAHLEPEILVVDEVLAVGDSQFQAKSLGKMSEITQDGRTVIFVSHNLGAVKTLCKTAIVLNSGLKTHDGPTDSAIDTYLRGLHDGGTTDLRDSSRRGTGAVRFDELTYERPPQTGKTLELKLRLSHKIQTPKARASIMFHNAELTPILLLSSDIVSERVSLEGSDKIQIKVPRFPLAAGLYFITLFLEVDGIVSDWIEAGVSLTVEGGDFFESGRLMPSSWRKQVAFVDHHWMRG